MNISMYATVMASFPPVIIASSWVAACFAVWSWYLRHDSEKQLRRLLVTGIAFGFAAVAIEKAFIFYQIINRPNDWAAWQFSNLELATSFGVKAAIWCGAMLHLHAMWKASFGRSFWLPFTIGSIALYAAGYWYWA